MTNIPDFIDKMNRTNSTNDKLEVLKSYKSDILVQRVLKMAYDKVAYSFHISMKNVKAGSSENTNELSWGLDQLEKLARREITGNAAIELLENVLEQMSTRNRDVIIKIINRDLRINVGRTVINKVFKGLIIKPCYCRCNVLSQDHIKNGKTIKGTNRNINYPAIVQTKADGTYREINIDWGSSFCVSRSGEKYSYPELEKELLKSQMDGYFIGEMTMKVDDKLLERILPGLKKSDAKNGTNDLEKIIQEYKSKTDKSEEYILPRGLSNGILNSDDVPQENIIYEVWDFISPEDYILAGLKDKNNKPKEDYRTRFNNLKKIIETLGNPNIRVIEYREVNSLKEALEFTQEKMKEGKEGAVLKDQGMRFKDGTSSEQLKIKVQFEIDARITGFIEGKKGTKREQTFGSMTYSTDDGMIQGSVSGFNDSQLEDFNKRRDELIGRVIEIEANDLTKARGSDIYALSHPRFICLRDKDQTDDLERAKLSLNNSMNLK